MKKRILIIDDNDAFLATLHELIEENGYLAIMCEHSTEALKLLDTDHYDLVISDIQLPELTGIELLKKVREKSQIPFVLMTGYSEISETINAASLGASGFISKPFEIDELLSLLDSLFNTNKDKLTQKYTSVLIDETQSVKGCPIFLQLSNQHFVKIAHSSSDLDSTKIAQLKSKGIKRLYFLTSDFLLTSKPKSK